jgi:hypothetical protein
VNTVADIDGDFYDLTTGYIAPRLPFTRKEINPNINPVQFLYMTLVAMYLGHGQVSTPEKCGSRISCKKI